MDDRRAHPSDAVTLVYIDVDAPHADRPTTDDVLADAVRRLRSQMRRGDSVGRYGAGLLALLDGAPADRGQAIVDRLLASLATTPFPSPRGDLRVRASAHLAQVGPGERLDDAARRVHHA